MHPRAPRWLIANATSREIARFLGDPDTGIEGAVRHLQSKYGLSPEAARRDVGEVLEAFRNHGMLDPPLVQEPRLKSLYLVLTERCNLACSHCSGAYPTRRELELPTAMRLVDELVAAGGQLLALSGGEPLLHPHLEPLLERIGKRLPVQFCTNGTLIDTRWARLFAETLDPRFQISLDGPDAGIHDAIRGPGSFEGALRGIRRLQEAGLGDRIIVATTIQRQNHEVLAAMVQRVQELGVARLRFLPLRREGRAREQWECTGAGLDEAAYARIFDRFLRHPGAFPREVQVSCGLSGFTLLNGTESSWCPVGDQLAVDASGEAFPCAVMMRREFRLGSIHERSLQALLQGQELENLREAKLRRRDRISECRPCRWRNFCQSGCMAQAYDAKGELEAPDPFCGYLQTAYERAFDRLLDLPLRAAPAPAAGEA